MSPVNVPAIGAYIREQREQAKISLRQLAQATGVSNPYLSQIERGLRKPSADILQQLAKGLRISAEALYVQAGFLEDRPEGYGVREAVLAAPELSERQKQMLLEIYESFRNEVAPDAEEAEDGQDLAAGAAGLDPAALTWPELADGHTAATSAQPSAGQPGVEQAALDEAALEQVAAEQVAAQQVAAQQVAAGQVAAGQVAAQQVAAQQVAAEQTAERPTADQASPKRAVSKAAPRTQAGSRRVTPGAAGQRAASRRVTPRAAGERIAPTRAAPARATPARTTPTAPGRATSARATPKAAAGERAGSKAAGPKAAGSMAAGPKQASNHQPAADAVDVTQPAEPNSGSRPGSRGRASGARPSTARTR